MKTAISILFISISLICTAQTPTPHGHAHNDYMHARPLFEALDNGFTSIEIDVHLYKGRLVVAHDAVGLSRKKDIEALYLKPIEKRIKENGGTVYKGDTTPVIFMIDFKTGSPETYAKLLEILAKYKPLISVYTKGNEIKRGALRILISGAKPLDRVAKEDTSIVTIDGSIGQLKETTYDKAITRYSDPWHKYFKWDGEGPMPPNEEQLLGDLVKQAHAKGKHIRFYAIPDKPAVWKKLLQMGVDWVNTDKLKAYKETYNSLFTE
jgi:glycerophosphoryl diester phosphodiesterase